MNTIENNDFMILNNIIYKIHSYEDFAKMQKNFLEQVAMILDFDSADFSLAKGDGSTNLVTEVGYNMKKILSKQFEDSDYSQGILLSGKSIVYRETDIINDDKRVKTEYYKNVYKPNNLHYALQLILGHNEIFLGVVTFYRNVGKSDFNYKDIFILELIKDHLSYRLFKENKFIHTSGNKLSIANAVNIYKLTKRESTVLKLILDGLSNDEICDKIIVTNNTLKKHILNIYRKIGVNNKIQLFKLIKDA